MFNKKLFVASVLTLAVVGTCLPLQFGTADAKEIVNNQVITKTFELSTDELPTSYKTRNIGVIADQGSHGDCWAFGALATLQINMNKMGFINENSEDGFYDFSESAIVKYASCKYCYDCHSTNVVYDKETNTYTCDACGQESIVGYVYGSPNSLNEAGSGVATTINYLISNPILIDESEWGYNTKYPIIPEPTSYSQYSFEINSVYESNGFDINELKNMVYSFGGVFLGHAIFNRNIGMTTYTDGENTYLAMCGQDMPIDAGHGVSIIGYDDNFSKENFKISKEQIVKYLENQSLYGASKEFIETLKTFDIYNQVKDMDISDENFVKTAIDTIRNMTDEEVFAKYGPKTDGAFVVKNSWGLNDQFTTGCYWIPYDQMDEMYVGESCYAFTSISATPISEKEYFYDELGARDAIIHTQLTEKYAKDGYYSFANIFNFENNSKLDYISLSTGLVYNSDDTTTNINDTFEYNLFYAPVVDGKILSDKKVLLKSGEYNGSLYYNKIFLDNNFIVPNEKGAIIIEIPTDAKFSLGVDISGPNDIVVVHENESLMMLDNEYVQAKFNDKICNFCIRAGTTQTTEQTNVFRADYTKYDELAKTIHPQNKFNATYTSESWDNFEKAKQQFENISQNLNLWQQDELNNVVNNYLNAYNNLQKDCTYSIVTAVFLVVIIYACVITTLFIINKRKSKKY